MTERVTHEPIAGHCPNDGTAVTFHWDEVDAEGNGIATGVPGGIYYGTCNYCHQQLVRERGPIVTTVGGGPSPLAEEFDRALARRAGTERSSVSDAATAVETRGGYDAFKPPEGAPDELHAEIAKLTPTERDQLLGMVKERNAQRAPIESPEPPSSPVAGELVPPAPGIVTGAPSDVPPSGVPELDEAARANEPDTTLEPGVSTEELAEGAPLIPPDGDMLGGTGIEPGV